MTTRIKSRQRGIVLVLTLLLLTALSYLLLLQLNATANKAIYHRQIHDRQVLKQAKVALLSYALMFPEITRSETNFPGPGLFPCPDRNNNGQAEGGSCSYQETNQANSTNFGLFPYKTLELPALTDSDGSRIWYFLSQTHRNNPAQIPLNSKQPNADLTLKISDDKIITDIVVILALPGDPIVGQNRIDPLNITHFLEGDNNDLDNDFVISNNDKILAISRYELMVLLEKRILKAAKIAINNYQAEQCNNDVNIAETPLNDTVDTSCRFPLITFSNNPDFANPDYDIESGYLPATWDDFAHHLPKWFVPNQWHHVVCINKGDQDKSALICHNKENTLSETDSCPNVLNKCLLL